MTIKIISGHAIFNENAVVFHKKFGWELETNFDPQPNDIYVVFGAHELAHQLLEIQFRKNSSFGYIILNSEQINSQFFKNKYYLSLMKRNIVMDYNTITANYLKETHDIRVLSYFFFEFMKSDIVSDRIYDVTFIGSKNENRDKIINQLKADHPELNFYVDFGWKHSSCESLTQILHQSKVVLNIPYYENNPLETHRINKALACGCDVISLMSAEEDANNFYKDYVYMTDNISKSLTDKGPKKSYEELVKTLSQKFNPHMLFIIDQVQKKLSNISNGDPVDKEKEEPTDIQV
jgi:hypothetical protein